MQLRLSDLEAIPLPDSRLRLASALLALVSLGLLLSLLPRTSFIARSADDIVDVVGPVWPEHSVEQVLDDGIGAVSEIRIWGAAGVGRGEAPVVAALVQGPDREVVRQHRVAIKPSHLPQAYVLEFPPYYPVPGEALILQLWVSDERRNHAIFGATAAGGEGGGPTLNLDATEQGPLAYELIWRGDGWRAALEGSWLDRLRLAGGIAAGLLALLLSPPVARRLSRAFRQIAGRLRPVGAWLSVTSRPAAPESRRRAIYVYPWLIPVFAILHYLSSNLFLLKAHEAIVPGAVILAGVTGVFLGLRVLLKSAASAALLTGLLGMGFFSYGHIFVGPEDHPDSRFLLGLGVPVIGALVLVLRGRSAFPHAIGRVLNYASCLLLVAPLYQIGLVLFAAPDAQDVGALKDPIVIDERITEVTGRIDPSEMPDIYYIIPDAYPRSGSPASFDNSEFVGELEDRGFYVDPQATSNYTSTPSSTTSSLNMSYLTDKSNRSATANWWSSITDIYQIYYASLDHALGKILTNIGYEYIHVSSGWFMTTTNRNADLVVDFTSSGPIESRYRETDLITHYPYTIGNAINVSNRFMRHFLQTTLVKHIDRDPCLNCIVSGSFSSEHPHRALQWIEYMKEIGNRDSPKLVVAHLVKPHFPYYFDRYGNTSYTTRSDGELELREWSDDHDPSVGRAFYGQVAWLNSELLDVIDAILDSTETPPMIVIMSDHGYLPELINTHDILAAYYLPKGGRSAVYSGITSVNVFRVILDYYFDFGLGRLDDRLVVDESG
ncbi:MAG: sulfatase-like hydrolase/transferase [Chloroflexi bacterium]|nr:sulfatase-like hydrolase/transferase [Chloroflexota bacterium]